MLLVILNLTTLSFMLLKESKEKWNLSFLEVVVCKLNWIWWKMVSCWRKLLMFLPPCLCSSLVLILPTFVSLLMRQSFQTIIPDNHSRQSFHLDEEGFLWLSFCSFGHWSNSFDLCRTLHALDASLSCICASCISLYALFCFVFCFWSYFVAFVLCE